jgi:DNA-binding IclR family transcriptional regulator
MEQRSARLKHVPRLVDNREPIPTQTIARAVDILAMLNQGMCGATAISKACNLNKATVHRLLKSLELTGLVMQDPDNRQYCLGPLVVKLSSNYLNIHQNLSICAHPEMQRLWEFSGETVSLLILVGINGMYLEEYVSPQLIRYNSGKGAVTPLHTGAGGKVILAQLSENKLKLTLKNLTFETRGPNTISDKEKLNGEIDKARKQGYAISFEETAVGGAAISLPVKNYVCPVAISIIGPDNRLAPKMMGLLEEMKISAERISNKLKEIYSADTHGLNAR